MACGRIRDRQIMENRSAGLTAQSNRMRFSSKVEIAVEDA